MMVAAELGLDCSGTMGSGYLVPFGGKCQFMPGYRGLMDLARRSGVVRKIIARPVYEGDDFSFTYGLREDLIHNPLQEDRGPNKLTYVYAIAWLDDNTTQFEVMSRAQVDAVRRRSKSSGDGPWVTDYVPMALKSVIRKLCKYLPMSTELVRAFEAEDEAEDEIATVAPPALGVAAAFGRINASAESPPDVDVSASESGAAVVPPDPPMSGNPAADTLGDFAEPATTTEPKRVRR